VNPDVVLIYFDPCHLQHNVVNARRWQIKGKDGTLNIKTNSGRQRINILGAFDFSNFKPIISLTEKSCNSEIIVEFFEQIKQQYPDKEIIIVLDNASYNRSRYTTEYANYYGITLYFLPPYSPNLNLIERLWKFTKKKLVHNTYYENFSLFKKEVEKFFYNIEDFKEELTGIITLKFSLNCFLNSWLAATPPPRTTVFIL